MATNLTFDNLNISVCNKKVLKFNTHLYYHYVKHPKRNPWH